MNILMVCLGNICRSPLAEGIMQHMVNEQGLGWKIDSAGTGNWHVGEGPDHRSVRVAHNHNIDISKQVCRQFKISDFDEFDRIFVMDRYNMRDVLLLARNQQDRQKVKLLLGHKEVPDPYYEDTQFAPVFRLVEEGCRELVEQLNRV